MCREMLLTPCRADCIIFGLDGVLLDVFAAYSAAAGQCLVHCWNEATGSEVTEENVFGNGALPLDLSVYCRAAQSSGCFESLGDAVWALLSLAFCRNPKDLSSALPSLYVWRSELEAAQKSGIDRFAQGAPVPRERVVGIFNELYFGTEGGESSLLGRPAEGARRLEKSLFPTRWDKLQLPVGICTPRAKDDLEVALVTLGWEDFPRNCTVTGEDFYKPNGGAIESLCRALGGSQPLYLGSAQAEFDLMNRYGRGDFLAVGTDIKNSAVRFHSAADALRALLGVV